MILGIPELLTSQTIFSVQKTCGAPTRVWLALRSSGHNKKQGECTNLRMGLLNELCPLTRMIAESVERVTHEDPAQGEWCVSREENNI